MSYQKFGYSHEYYKEMVPNNSRRCMCSSCGAFFNSVSAFDKHRTGDPQIDRHCMTVAEMTQAGMSRNKSGHWVSMKMDSERSSFTAETTSRDDGGGIA